MQDDNQNQITSTQPPVSPPTLPTPGDVGMVVGDAVSAPKVTSYNELGAPLLTSDADLRHHAWGGMPHRVGLSLFENYLTIVREKDGQTLLNAPLSDLKKVKKGTDYITFKANGKRYQLEFALLSEKEKNYLLGGAGGSIYSVAKHTGDAKAWKDALISRGVPVGRAWM